MFEDLNTSTCVIIFKGLKTLIDTGDGEGFHNSDMGHPVYRAGAAGERSVGFNYADRPKENDLFYMLVELSKRLKSEGFADRNWWYDFSDWKSFCQYVVTKYDRRHGYGDQRK